MASIGDGISSEAIEQDPGVAQLQAQQLAANSVLAGIPATGFVASINAISGQITIQGGTNISVTSDGVSTITISTTGIDPAATAPSNVTNVPPNASNDESEGWEIFSLWLDTSVPNFWMCASNTTMAAVWVLLG